VEHSALRQRLPNILTIGRLGLTIVFLALLSGDRYPADGPGRLTIAFVIFTFAAATDALDGYLARRWSAQSVFGRVMDPLCDKILILGSLVMLAGPGFAAVESVDVTLNATLVNVTGIESWMVVVVLLRELIVTGLRTFIESSGKAFGAGLSGKLKMILQSITIPALLLIVAYADPMEHAWSAKVRDGLVWSMVIVTALSAGPYVVRAHRILRSS
jgi:phosphatidylglycerophosphate synthase